MKELLPWAFWLIGIYCVAKAIELWRSNEYNQGFSAGYNVRAANDIVLHNANAEQVRSKPERDN